MSERSGIERALDGFLAEGPETVADHALMRALDAVDRTHQRRGPFASWRFPIMNSYTRLAAAAVVAVVAVGGAMALIGPRGGVGSSSPAPTPTAIPSAALGQASGEPQPTIDLAATWTTFTSVRYGYSMAHPSGSWGFGPATQSWAGESASDMSDSDSIQWADKLWNDPLGILITGVAVPTVAGSEKDWFEGYLAPPEGSTPTCVEKAGDLAPILIDGRPGWATAKCPETRFALVKAGGFMYVFGIDVPSETELFTTFLSKVRLPAS